MKKRILSSCVISLSLSASMNAWSELPGLDTIKPIRTYDVGQSAEDTNIVIMNHNKDHQVLLVELDENEKHVAFAVADLSIAISEEEAIAHLKSSFLTGDKAGFLDDYPNVPTNLSEYTSLGFDELSNADGFSAIARKMIVETTGYLQSQNLSIPWQNGYAALNISDSFISVDDVAGGYTNGFFKCPLTGWNETVTVTSMCDSVDADFSFEHFIGSGNLFPYLGTGKSDSSFARDFSKVYDLSSGRSSDSIGLSLIHTTNNIVRYSTDEDGALLISVNELSGIDTGTKTGKFIESPWNTLFQGFPEIGGAFTNGDIVVYSNSELDTSRPAKSCTLKHGFLDFGDDPNLTTATNMNDFFKKNPLEDRDIYKLFLESYPSPPENHDALNDFLVESGSDIQITNETTTEEYRSWVDELFLNSWTNEIRNNFPENSDEFFSCADEPKPFDIHIIPASILGSLFMTDIGTYGSSIWDKKENLPSNQFPNAMIPYIQSYDGNYEILSDVLFDYLTKGLSLDYLNSIQNKVLIDYPEYFAGYPNIPEESADKNQLLFEKTMSNAVLNEMGFGNSVMSSLDSEGSVLIGRHYKGRIFSGLASKNSYLVYKKSSIVRIIPDRLTIDPYDDSALTTKIELETENLYGAELLCQFDEASLHYQDSSYSNFFNTPFKFELPISNTGSEWFGATALFGAAEAVTGIGDFAEIHHQAALTTANVTLTCNAIFSDSEGNSMPVVSEEIVVRIDDGIHGVAGESGEIRGSIDLPVSINGQPVEVSVSINGRTISASSVDGEFIFENLRDGLFTMTVKTDNHVAACTTVEIIDGAAVSIETIELVSGDINGDGIIDIGDYTLLSASYGLSAGEEGYSEVLDLNLDGLINIQDVSILGSHFNAVSCIQ